MFKRILTPSILSLTVLSQINTASAQQIAALQLNEADFFSDFPVVLTATRLKQPQKNAPIATTIIDREMIEASGFTNIADLLRLAPNMIVSYDGGHIPAVGYSSLLNRYTVRMQVMVDGRSVYTPIFGEMYWTSLGLAVEDIERIEVIRGPSSSSYGPNAMTGVISIITKYANIDKGSSIKVTAGPDGVQEQHFKNSDTIGNLSYRLSLTHRENNGLETRYDDSDINIINLKSNYQVDNNDEVEFNLAYNSGRYGEDNVFSEDDVKTNPDDYLHPKHDSKRINESYQVKWTHSFQNNNSFSLNYYQQQHDVRNDHMGLFGGFPVNNKESLLSKRKNLEFAHLISGEKYKLIWGGVYRTDETTAPLYLYNVSDNQVKTTQYYINTSYDINNNNTLNAGYMYDDNDLSDSSHSKRLSLNHHINDNHTVRLSYATSTRTPFIFEERSNYYYEEFGGVQIYYDKLSLSPEEITSYDLGLNSTINSNTNFDLRIFKNTLSNLIFTNEDATAAFFDNGESYDIKGVEFSVHHKFNDGWLRGNIAHNKIDNISTIETDADDYKNSTPDYNVSLISGYNLDSTTTININYYYTGRMKNITSSHIQDSQDKVDLKLSKKFKLGGNNATASLMIYNVTNNDYLIPFRDKGRNTPNGFNRSGYASLKIDF